MAVVVLPFLMSAIGGGRGGIDTVLAQHVAPVDQPCVQRAKPVRHRSREVCGSRDRQSCGSRNEVFSFHT